MLTRIERRHHIELPVGVTEEEFRGWVREWFKEQVVSRAAGNDRAFARLTSMTATEVNDIRNDKRYPSWGIIEKATKGLGWRADDFLLDIVKRARADADKRATGGLPPIPPKKPDVPPGTLSPAQEVDRRALAAKVAPALGQPAASKSRGGKRARSGTRRQGK